jgi:hypothetical protein
MMDVLWVVLFWGLIAALWWLYAFAYRQYRIDLLRQRLFRVRDELFNEAAAERIDFNSPAYGMMRTTLNGMIQFAHELSLIRLVIMFIAQRLFGKGEIEDLYRRSRASAYRDLSQEQRRLVMRAEVSMHMCVLSHVVYTSLPLFLTVAPLLWLLRQRVRNKHPGDKLLRGKRARDHWASLDAEANGLGAVGMSHAFAR